MPPHLLSLNDRLVQHDPNDYHDPLQNNAQSSTQYDLDLDIVQIKHPIFLTKVWHYVVAYHDHRGKHVNIRLHHVLMPIHTLPQYDLHASEHHLLKAAPSHAQHYALLWLFRRHQLTLHAQKNRQYEYLW